MSEIIEFVSNIDNYLTTILYIDMYIMLCSVIECYASPRVLHAVM